MFVFIFIFLANYIFGIYKFNNVANKYTFAKDINIKSADIGKIELQIRKIEQLPVLVGEKDTVLIDKDDNCDVAVIWSELWQGRMANYRPKWNE